MHSTLDVLSGAVYDGLVMFQACPLCGAKVTFTAGGYVHEMSDKATPACQLECLRLLAIEKEAAAEPAAVDWRAVALDHARTIRDLQAQNQALLDRNNEMVAERRSGIRAKVREFMVMANQPLPERPEIPSETILRLRVRLMVEEFCECLEASLALDTYVVATGETEKTLCMVLDMLREATETAAFRVNFPELIDGLGDLDYVVQGFRDALGVDGGPVFDLIHAANMTKLGGPIVNGKLTKPPNFRPPDIAAELRRQGWNGKDGAL